MTANPLHAPAWRIGCYHHSMIGCGGLPEVRVARAEGYAAFFRT